MSNPSQGKWFLDKIFEAFENLSSSDSAEKLTSTFVNGLSEMFDVSKVSFMLLDEAKGELSIKAFQGLDPAATGETVKLGESFSGRVAREGVPLLVRDIENQFPLLPKPRASHYTTKSFVIVPVKLAQRTIGVVSLTDRRDGALFDESDLKALYLVSRYFALCLESKKSLKE